MFNDTETQPTFSDSLHFLHHKKAVIICQTH